MPRDTASVHPGRPPEGLQERLISERPVASQALTITDRSEMRQLDLGWPSQPLQQCTGKGRGVFTFTNLAEGFYLFISRQILKSKMNETR